MPERSGGSAAVESAGERRSVVSRLGTLFRRRPATVPSPGTVFRDRVFPMELEDIAARQKAVLGEIKKDLAARREAPTRLPVRRSRGRGLKGVLATARGWLNLKWWRRGGSDTAPDRASIPKSTFVGVTPSTELGLVGLALSGGGIRSATFNLGVLQSLAARRVFDLVDYLSTVSGGGYLGSCLSSLLAHGPGQRPESEPAFPLGVVRDGKDQPAVRHLRNSGNFLATGTLDFARIPALLLRGIVLHLLVLLPYVLAAVWFTEWWVGKALREAALRGEPTSFWKPLGWASLIALAWVLVYPLVLYLRAKLRDRGPTRQTERFWLRDLLNNSFGILLVITLVVGVVVLLPTLLSYWHHRSGAAPALANVPQEWWWVAGSSLVASVLAGLGATTRSKLYRQLALAGLALVGPMIFLALYLALAEWCVFSQVPWPTPVEPFFSAAYFAFGFRVPEHLLDSGWWFLTLVVAALTAYTWRLVDMNTTSMHGFYRDRLSKAYLLKPATDDSRPPIEHNDSQRLSQLGVAAPYHIVNAALNLQANKDPDLRDRQADFFFFSKRFVGGRRTGFCTTEELERADERVDLGTAMAISAAAAAPNMGSTTIKALSLLMALFNVRLGYWLPNPRVVDAGWPVWKAGVGPRYLIKEALGAIDEDDEYVNLSDGGHIENLGVFELLRRRCKFIIACDAEADPDLSFGSLARLMRFAKIDEGIDIQIDLDDIRRGDGQLSRSHCAFGRIRYPPSSGEPEGGVGLLLYLKASVTGFESESVREYRSRSDSFPHESTGDQFFNEAQFESYRELGFRIAESLFEGPVQPIDAKPDRFAAWFSFLEAQLRPSFPAGGVFVELRQQLTKVEQRLQEPAMAAYAYQIYPEMGDPRALEAPDEENLRRIFHFCNGQLQLMENAVVALGLDKPRNQEHHLNRGWMNLFQRWAQAAYFRSAWAISIGTYSLAFQQFCEQALGLRSGLEFEQGEWRDLTPGERSDLIDWGLAEQDGPTDPLDRIWIVRLAPDVGSGETRSGSGQDAGWPTTAPAFPIGFCLIGTEKHHDGTSIFFRCCRIRDVYRRMRLFERLLPELRARLLAEWPGAVLGVAAPPSLRRQVTRVLYLFERHGFRALAADQDGHWRARKAALQALARAADKPDEMSSTMVSHLRDDREDWRVRSTAARALEGAGRGADAADQLVAHLEDPNEEVRLASARALRGFAPKPQVRRALFARLHDRTESWRVRSAAAFSVAQTPRAAETLVSLFRSEREDWRVREALARAFAATKNRPSLAERPGVRYALLASLVDRHDNLQVRLAVAASLAGVADHHEVRVRLLARLEDRREDSGLRGLTSEALARSADLGDGLPKRLEALLRDKSESWQVRSAAAAALGKLPGREPPSRFLIDCFLDRGQDQRLRLAAAEALAGSVEHRAVQTALIERLADGNEDRRVRESAARALGGAVAGVGVRRALLGRLQQRYEDLPVQTAVVGALAAAVARPEVRKVLLSRLEDGDGRMRRAAAEALSEAVNRTEVRAALLSRLSRDPQPRVRADAARALGGAAEREDIRRELAACLGEGQHWRVRAAAAEALEPVAGHQDVRAELLGLSLRQETDSRARAAAARALAGATGDSEVRWSLVSLLTERDERVRLAAAQALARVADEKAREALRKDLPAYLDPARATYRPAESLQRILLFCLGNDVGEGWLVRSAAAALLAPVADQSAVARVLCARLEEDTDARVRRAAARSLGAAVGLPDARAALLSRLSRRDERWQVRVAAATSLAGAVGRIEVRWALESRLDLEGEDERVRLAAARSLAAADHPEAKQALSSRRRDGAASDGLKAVVRIASDPAYRARSALSEACTDLARIGDAIAGTVDSWELRHAIISRLEDGRQDLESRLAAARALGGLTDHTEVWKVLLASLRNRDDEPELRAAAALLLLPAAREDEVARQLRCRLEESVEKEPTVRAAAAMALAGSPSWGAAAGPIRDALSGRLADKDKKMRAAAVSTLGQLAARAEPVEDLLAGLRNHPSPRVERPHRRITRTSATSPRLAALQVVAAAVDRADVCAAVVHCLEDKDPEVRREAARVLASAPDQDDLRRDLLAKMQELRAKLRGESAPGREMADMAVAAIEALSGSVHHNEVIEALVGLARQPLAGLPPNDRRGTKLRKAAISALTEAAGRPEVREALLPLLETNHDDAEARLDDPAARLAAVEALRASAHHTTREALRKLLKTGERDDKLAAVRALAGFAKGDLNFKVRADLVERLLGRFEDRPLRIAAASALAAVADENKTVVEPTRVAELVRRSELSEDSAAAPHQAAAADNRPVLGSVLHALLVGLDDENREGGLREAAADALLGVAERNPVVRDALLLRLERPYPPQVRAAAPQVRAAAARVRAAAARALAGTAVRSEVRNKLVARLRDAEEEESVRVAAVSALAAVATFPKVEKALWALRDDRSEEVRQEVRKMNQVAGRESLRPVRAAQVAGTAAEPAHLPDHLLSLVEDPENALEVRAAAAEALAPFSGREHLRNGLLERLRDERERVQVQSAAARGLAPVTGRTEVRDLLISLIADRRKHPDVRAAAAESLREFSPRDVVGNALLRSLRGGDGEEVSDEVRLAAVRALAAADSDDCSEALLERLEEDASSRVRGAAASALATSTGKARVLRGLLDRLQDRSETSLVVRSAAEALAGVAAEDQVRGALLDRLGDRYEQPEVRTAAAAALRTAVDQPLVLNALLSHLDDRQENEAVRLSAARAVTGVADRDGVRGALIESCRLRLEDHDEDAMVRRAAAQALAAATSSAKVREALLAQFDDPSDEVRRGVAGALREAAGRQDVRRRLLELLRKGSERERIAAAGALSSEAGKEGKESVLVRDMLMVRLNSERGSVRAAVVQALRGAARLVQGQLLSRLEKSSDHDLRAATAAVLAGAADQPEVSELLVKRLKEPTEDTRVRSAAAAALAAATCPDEAGERRPSVPVREVLIAQLENRGQSWEIRAGAAKALSWACERPLVLTALLSQLDDGQEEVRLAVVQALARAAHLDTVRGRLIESLHDRSNAPAIRLAAIRALAAESGTAEARKALISSLQDGESEIRVAAAEALADWGQASGTRLGAVIGGVRSEDPKERLRSVKALGASILEAEARDALRHCLQSQDKAVRLAAARLLAGAVHQAEVRDALIERLKDQNEHPRVRGAAAGALEAAAGHAEVWKALADSLKDKDEQVRRPAVGALIEVAGHGQVRASLLGCLANGEEPEKVAAAQALAGAVEQVGDVRKALLNKLTGQDVPPALRLTAARALARASNRDDGEVREALFAVLQSRDGAAAPAVRRTAAQALAKAAGRKDVRARLEAGLRSEPLAGLNQALPPRWGPWPAREAEEVELGVLQALSAADRPRWRPALVAKALRLLEDEANGSEARRVAALRALEAEADQPSVTNTLLSRLRADPSPEVRCAAASALAGAVHLRRVRKALLSRFRLDESPAVRVAAAVALAGVVHLRRVSKALLSRFRLDESPAVRVAAAVALAEVGDQARVREVLLRALSEKDEDVRLGVAEALTWFAPRDEVDDALMQLEDRDPQQRSAAEDMLNAAIDRRRVRDALLSRLRDPKQARQTRLAAVRILEAAVEHRSVKKALSQIRNDEEEDSEVHSALTRLLAAASRRSAAYARRLGRRRPG